MAEHGGRRPLRSTLEDAAAIEERMEAMRLKQLLDPENLSERERMCLQMEQSGFPCQGVRRAG
jgi:hypothetical protein